MRQSQREQNNQNCSADKSFSIDCSDVAFVIPSRIGSTRLPRKALVNIGDQSMIERVVFSLKEYLGPNLYVAADSEEILKKAEEAGAKAIMTSENCMSGSDRVYEAFQKIENNANIKYVVNIQGDMPFINYKIIEKIVNKLKTSRFDIVTAAIEVERNIADNESNVKIVTDSNNSALYFSRSLIPSGAEKFLYHVGVYAFKANALEKFVKLPKARYESLERLEQLRALENGMSIGVVVTSDEIPISVDTQEDLEKAREYYKKMLKREIL